MNLGLETGAVIDQLVAIADQFPQLTNRAGSDPRLRQPSHPQQVSQQPSIDPVVLHPTILERLDPQRIASCTLFSLGVLGAMTDSDDAKPALHDAITRLLAGRNWMTLQPSTLDRPRPLLDVVKRHSHHVRRLEHGDGRAWIPLVPWCATPLLPDEPASNTRIAVAAINETPRSPRLASRACHVCRLETAFPRHAAPEARPAQRPIPTAAPPANRPRVPNPWMRSWMTGRDPHSN